MTSIKGGMIRRIVMLLMVFTLCFSAMSVAHATGTATGSSPEAPATANSGVNGIFDDYVGVSGDGTITVKDGTDGNALRVGGVVSKYKSLAVVITSVLTVTTFLFMLLQFTKLAAAGDNDSARKKAIAGILTTGIATALFGGASIIIGFFWNFLGTNA